MCGSGAPIIVSSALHVLPTKNVFFGVSIVLYCLLFVVFVFVFVFVFVLFCVEISFLCIIFISLKSTIYNLTFR